MNKQQMLDSLRRRPALWWGGGDHPFTSLVAFLSGYAVGFREATTRSPVTPAELVPHDFHKFVTERFGRTFPDGGKGWMCFIRENTSSYSDAFDLFFRLRADYEQWPAKAGDEPGGTV